MSGLEGARIALLEARLASELAELVRREGGEPVCAPAVREVPADVTALIPRIVDDVRRGRVDVAVFLTGAGAACLLEQADRMGRRRDLVEALAGITTACRGPKPAAVLRRHGIPVRLSGRAPHTTATLLEALPAEMLAGRGVVLLHDGGGNPSLAAALLARGARVREVHAYTWRLPADVAPLERLVDELIDGHVDAVAFTSQIQVRHLLEIGACMQRSSALLHALNCRTVVASIGPTCSAVLEGAGVSPHVVASPPRMRPLVTAIGEHLAARRSCIPAEAIPS